MRKILAILALCMLPMAAYADEPTNAPESQQEPTYGAEAAQAIPMYENGVDVSYGAPGTEEQTFPEAAALEGPQTLNAYDGVYEFGNVDCSDCPYGNSFYSYGVAYLNDQEFKWYSQNVAPGDGLHKLNSNGRHVDESTGFVVDGDGYISVASPWGRDEIGTVVETPFGLGRVYDVNEGDAYDIYTDF